MKISSFSVKNYRSIVDAHIVKLKDYNVLIGKNNEGKSNILKALSVCMSCISDYKRFRYGRLGYKYRDDVAFCNWQNDFPIQLRNRKNGKDIIFEISFDLSSQEIKDFNKQLGTRINSNTLVMKIKIGPDDVPNITFPKKGTAQLTKKKAEVLEYLSDKISYNYIPTIRTKRNAVSLIRENVARELKVLKNDIKYIDAIEMIKSLQNNLLSSLAQDIKLELKELLPKVDDVKISIDDDYDLGFSIRDINVMVDDGVLTNIEDKGDGVNSLAVMAILKNKKNKDIDSTLIAIDEPEAHLHPGAIIELSNNLKRISMENQVIISTHNATFIDVENISNNIIVDSGKAKPAKNVKDVREVLGIQVEDYMVSSRIILLVEGECDEIILKKILSDRSLKIKKALDSKELGIKRIDSASKLSYHLSLLKNEICKTIVFLDGDTSGKVALNREIEEKNIDYKDAFVLNCDGFKESELEDIIKPEIYASHLFEYYGININRREFRGSKKWSDRLKKCIELSGKMSDEKIVKNIKIDIAELVCKSKDVCIEEKMDSVNNLINRLNELIK